jgi:16S rRNA (uracil1498-N3)-methyltransferase
VRRRFFVEQFADKRAVLEGEAAHHIGRVLRAQEGQLYELSDGREVWLGRIERAGRNRVEFALIEEIPAYQPSVRITLLLSIVKFDAFEWAIEKATELGVSKIIPIAASRSEKALVTASRKRAERWRKILIEASQQSRRVSVPALDDVRLPDDAFADETDGVRILLSERPDAQKLQAVVGGLKVTSATLAIGPEGGWTEREFGLAREWHDFKEASLGKLVLRTETAVVAALASLNYAFSS